MVLHDSDEGARRLDRFREQRSKSGMEESGAGDINDNDGTEEGTGETPYEEETRGEPIDQGYEGNSNRNSDKESGSTDTTPDGSCSPAFSQDSVQFSHHYSLGHCASGGSWADQCLSKDGGDLVSVEEESASCGTIEEDDREREKPPTPPASLQGKQESTEESWGGQRSRKTPTRLPLLQASSCLPTAKTML